MFGFRPIFSGIRSLPVGSLTRRLGISQVASHITSVNAFSKPYSSSMTAAKAIRRVSDRSHSTMLIPNRINTNIGGRLKATSTSNAQGILNAPLSVSLWLGGYVAKLRIM